MFCRLSGFRFMGHAFTLNFGDAWNSDFLILTFLLQHLHQLLLGVNLLASDWHHVRSLCIYFIFRSSCQNFGYRAQRYPERA